MSIKSNTLIALIGAALLLSAPVHAQVAGKDSTKAAKADSAHAAEEAALEAELARELGAISTEESAPAPKTDQPQRTGLRGSVASTGSSMNPRISVIGTFLGLGTSNGAVARTADVGLSEAEFSFQAYVDPYTKADFFVAFGHENEDPFVGPDEEAATDGEYETEIEEGYLTTLSLPFSLQIKAGKFRSTFGKINSTHPHALNFLDLPRMYVNYLGGEGLNDRGLSINWLIPNPFEFYQELTFEVTSGAVAAPAFAGSAKHLLYLLHLKNFFDLNENTTLEVGFSGVDGPNAADGHKTRVGAVDLTLRWKPLRRNRYKSFEWITEALWSRYEAPGATITSNALYSFLRYQVGKRWFVGARYDYSEFPTDGQAHERAYSAILSFFTTEFQKIELQYQHGLPAGRDAFDRILLRAVFVIGAHGAHKY